MPEDPWDLERHFGARWRSHRAGCKRCADPDSWLDIEAMIRGRSVARRCPQGDSLYTAWQHWSQRAREAR